MKRAFEKFGYALLAVAAVGTIGGQRLLAQDDNATPAAAQLPAYYATIPWTEGTVEHALAQASTGITIPLVSYTYGASKDGKTYTGVLVGGNFETAAVSKIPTVVVPVKVTIGSSVFDPNANNSCDGNVSATNRFNLSPLIQSSPLTFNGVSVGTTQYTDGFMRAEFHTVLNSGYHTTLSPVSYAAEVSVTASEPSQGSLYSSGCSQLGIVSYNWFATFLTNEITALTNAHKINSTDFVIFLVKNVVQSTATPPSASSGCCILGFHTAQGNPATTWGVMDWETSGDFSGTHDASVSSHEIAEWMNDPLANNATPKWGGIGQVSGCQGNFEVGDPLSGKLMPAISLNGYSYHVQELAFISWYFTADGGGSYGTGGKFSGNGTFKGPSKACPPGGTY